MPTAFMFTFKAHEGFEPNHRDLHRLACWMLEGPRNPDHHRQDKAFSVGPLRRCPTGGDGFELRINWLRDDDRGVEDRVRTGLRRGMKLGEDALDVVEVQAQRTTFGDLATLPPTWDCTFRFVSPTYFSRSGRDYLLPDPELISSDLVARWNQAVGQSSSFCITAEMARCLGSRLVLKRHALSTERFVSAGPGTGFVGQARLGLRAVERSTPEGRAAGELFASLCGFVPFCGLGAQTAYGLGAVDVLLRDG